MWQLQPLPEPVCVRTAIDDAQSILHVQPLVMLVWQTLSSREYSLMYHENGLSLVFDLAVGRLTACRLQSCFNTCNKIPYPWVYV